MSSHSISVTMPTPRPDEPLYFSGRSNDPIAYFLFKYEILATGRGLSDSQKVETIVHYLAPSIRDLWKTLDGYSTGDWETFKSTLENLYPDTSSATRCTTRNLQDFVDISAKNRMQDEDDVMTYYRNFLTLSNPLFKKELSDWDRNAEFFRGFHPDDRKLLGERLMCIKPYHHTVDPYELEDVLTVARREFSGRQLSDFLPRRLRKDPINLEQVDPKEWMRRVFGPEDRDPRRCRQDRESQYDRSSMADRDSWTDYESYRRRDSPRGRDFQDMPASNGETSFSAHASSYFRPRPRTKGCIFCTDSGHHVYQCSIAKEYVRTGHALIIHDRLHLPNGQPIPKDRNGHGLKSAIDKWLAADAASPALQFTT